MSRRVSVMAAAALFVIIGGVVVLTLTGDRARTLPDPVASPRTERIDDQTLRMWPRSAPVKPDATYRIETYTHCGLDYALDFDGAYWELVAAPINHWEQLDDPFDVGRIRLAGEDIAIYESSTGGQFRLNRLEGPRDVGYCE